MGGEMTDKNSVPACVSGVILAVMFRKSLHWWSEWSKVN